MQCVWNPCSGVNAVGRSKPISAASSMPTLATCCSTQMLVHTPPQVLVLVHQRHPRLLRNNRALRRVLLADTSASCSSCFMHQQRPRACSDTAARVGRLALKQHATKPLPGAHAPHPLVSKNGNMQYSKISVSISLDGPHRETLTMQHSFHACLQCL